MLSRYVCVWLNQTNFKTVCLDIVNHLQLVHGNLKVVDHLKSISQSYRRLPSSLVDSWMPINFVFS